MFYTEEDEFTKNKFSTLLANENESYTSKENSNLIQTNNETRSLCDCEEIAMHRYIYNKYMQLNITAAISSHLEWRKYVEERRKDVCDRKII